MIFFEFDNSVAPPSAIGPSLAAMGKYQSTGKFVHFKKAGETHHYFGHTDDDAMNALGDVLHMFGIPYRRITEAELPDGKRRTLAALRRAGLLG